jgi:hypothetical protein
VASPATDSSTRLLQSFGDLFNAVYVSVWCSQEEPAKSFRRPNDITKHFHFFLYDLSMRTDDIIHDEGNNGFDR